MGDVAMLQVAVARLRSRWPAEPLRVLTSDASALVRCCPDVTPIVLPDYPDWCTDRYVAGRLHSWLSDALSDRLAGMYVGIGCRAPLLREHLIRLRATLRVADSRSLDDFLTAIAGSRLLLVSGAGGVGDPFGAYSNLVLLALQCAHRRGIPTAMVSHGFAPLTAPHLRAKASVILPQVDFIALREARASRPLLGSLGVPLDRVATTGDDAIELAYGARREEPGTAVGINFRVARAAGTTETDIHGVAKGVQQFASRVDAAHVPLPIARQRNLDTNAIRLLLATFATAATDTPDPDTPLKVIEQVSRCRIVVTGAYHAAVFALAQGIPAVCVARSQYSMDRFLGLADQFQCGCYIISLDDVDVPGRVAEAMALAWKDSERVRSSLRSAAARQIGLGHQAYDALQTLLEGGPHRRDGGAR
jgi:polysaccharide pyruvyl transferase WcaK-like protein